MSGVSSRVVEMPEATDAELLALLGLGAGASDAQLEEAHDELIAYLERAPASLRGWARSRIAEADEAYAILSGESPDGLGQPGTPAERDGHDGGAPRNLPPKPRHHALTHGAAQATGDWLAGDALGGDGASATTRVRPTPPTKPARRASQRQTRQPEPEQSAVVGGYRAIAANPMFRKLAIAVAAVGALVIVGFAGYQLGNPGVPAINGSPNPSGSAGGLDLAAVSADMQKITANPKDTVALQDLADLYYAAGDYPTAGTWIARILVVDPANVSALLGKGAVAFNLGDLTAAEAAWRQVLTIDSKNLEAHYDLGFMYLKQNPPDAAKAKAEWQQVIDIAPDSDVAKTIQTHLASLGGTASPSTSPGSSGVAATPSSSPLSSAAPSVPAASPSPSGS